MWPIFDTTEVRRFVLLELFFFLFSLTLFRHCHFTFLPAFDVMKKAFFLFTVLEKKGAKKQKRPQLSAQDPLSPFMTTWMIVLSTVRKLSSVGGILSTIWS